MIAGLNGVTNRWLQRFWQRADRSGGEDSCWVWHGAKSADGYGRAKFNGKDTQVHRISWMLRHGRIPDGLCIRHRCDNRPCCNPAHLEIGTWADNVRDMVIRGRHLRGESAPSAKLTAENVEDIRRGFRNGVTRYQLAARFGVCHKQICNIVSGAQWKHSATTPSVEFKVPPSHEWRAMLRERIDARRGAK